MITNIDSFKKNRQCYHRKKANNSGMKGQGDGKKDCARGDNENDASLMVRRCFAAFISPLSHALKLLPILKRLNFNQ